MLWNRTQFSFYLLYLGNSHAPLELFSISNMRNVQSYQRHLSHAYMNFFFFLLREDKEQNYLVLLIYRILLNCSLKFLLDLPTPVLSTQLLGISSRGTLQAGVNALRARGSRESIQEGHEERWCSKHAPLRVTPGWPAVMTPCGGCREEKEGERYLPLKCPAHGSGAVQSRNVEQMDSYSYQGRPLELLAWPLRVRVFSNYVKYLCISGLTIHF